MIWLGIVIGIIVMQFITLIVAWVSNEREDVLIPFSVFIFYPLIKLFQRIGCYVRSNKKNKK